MKREGLPDTRPLIERPRVRAVVVLAGSWAALWAMLGATLGLVSWARGRENLDIAWIVGLMFAVGGALSGATYGGVVTGRRMTPGGCLSVRRAAAVAAVTAGSVVTVLVTGVGAYGMTLWSIPALFVVAATLGCVTAMVLIRLTRRALAAVAIDR